MSETKVLERLEHSTGIDSSDNLAIGEGAASQSAPIGSRMQRTLEKYRTGQLITLDELIARVRGE